jgi:hypothetical protein
MEIDWGDLETRLFELCASDIKRFANAHSDETFYGFALDCNADYGDVFLCVNTPDDLSRTSTKYAAKHSEGTSEWEAKLKWALGDWKYQGFNSAEFDADWKAFQDAVEDASLDEEEDPETFQSPSTARFLETCCRVAIRLEQSGTLSVLKRTPDFQVFVADHDESDETSWARLKAVEATLSDAAQD